MVITVYVKSLIYCRGLKRVWKLLNIIMKTTLKSRLPLLAKQVFIRISKGGAYNIECVDYHFFCSFSSFLFIQSELIAFYFLCLHVQGGHFSISFEFVNIFFLRQYNFLKFPFSIILNSLKFLINPWNVNYTGTYTVGKDEEEKAAKKEEKARSHKLLFFYWKLKKMIIL